MIQTNISNIKTRLVKSDANLYNSIPKDNIERIKNFLNKSMRAKDLKVAFGRDRFILHSNQTLTTIGRITDFLDINMDEVVRCLGIMVKQGTISLSIKKYGIIVTDETAQSIIAQA